MIDKMVGSSHVTSLQASVSGTDSDTDDNDNIPDGESEKNLNCVDPVDGGRGSFLVAEGEDDDKGAPDKWKNAFATVGEASSTGLSGGGVSTSKDGRSCDSISESKRM